MPQIDPANPPSWFLGGIFAIGVLIFIGLIYLNYRVVEWRNGSGRKVLGRRTSVQRYRSRVQPPANQRSARSARLNAEKGERSSVQPFVQGSAVQGDQGLPTTLVELRQLAHALVLYGRRPNKQAAIEVAWGCTKGEGPDWQRASWLFDLALPADSAARAEAKKKLDVSVS